MRFLRSFRLLALPPRHLAAAWRAQWALLRARRATLRQPLGELVQVIEPGPSPAAGSIPEAVLRLEQSIALASRSGLFRPSCLVRSLALQDLMKRDGLTVDGVRIGVRWVDGEFRAYASADAGS